MNHRLELLARPDAAIRDTILGGLRTFNSTVMMPGLDIQDLAVVIRDQDGLEALGGLWGRTGWEWLTIELIFVPERLRGQGIARRLIAMAEEAALGRGCHSAWLDTLNPDALRLYESLGYSRFGELKDYPPGGRRVFLQKRLRAS